MQQGMLFHTLYAPEAGVYFEQLSLTLHGNLNRTVFKQAWQQVIERHPVLRTLIVLKNRAQPLQLVKKRVQLPWTEYDWRNGEACEQRLAEFLQADQEQSFVLEQAPLMRCSIMQIADDMHYFVWSSHHLLMDGWCLPILLKEVFTFYESQQFFSPKPRPYQDYIAWLQQQDLSKAKAFWSEQLQDFTAPTPFRVDKMASDISGKYLKQSFGLSQAITERLQSLAHKHHLTLNTFVQGAWALLLSRYSGDNDIVFGATVSGRPTDLAGVESMVGLFINTLPVRVIIAPELLLLPWLTNLYQTQIECGIYSYTPLVEIQKNSELPNDIPLFESLLVFENYPMDKSLSKKNIGSLTISAIQSFEKTNYPLTLAAFVHENKLKFEISYTSNRFASDTIIQMLRHLTTLLEGMTTQPETKQLGDISLLTTAEQQQLLDWNDTAIDYPKDQCVHQLFETQVEATPEAIAIIFEEQQLTYRELNNRANQLANYLQTLGIKPETLVGICIERSLEMVIGLFGILKAGGAYLPLDPTYPIERLEFMLEDAKVPVLLTQTNLKDKWSHSQIICLDTDIYSQFNQDNLYSLIKFNNLAYVIYTSGSTGKPKGVQITHSSLVNLLTAMRQQPGISSSDVLLAVTTLAFDIAALEIYLPLIVGAKIVLASRKETSDGVQLLEKLNKITIMQATPATWHLLIMAVWKKGNSQLKILCGGEKLTNELVNQLLQRGKTVWNLYGPTETTIWSTTTQILNSDNISIGRPIANTQIYILDSQQNHVPIGVPGELHIGGVGLARGYLNRPELTAEKFIKNPFSDAPNSRIYKTGDLARYLPDGNIEYLGRIDNQVKIRGFRIELGEIEAVLGQHPSVRENSVIVHETDSNDKRLIAYLVLHQVVEKTELRHFLKARLPDYMLPSAFVTLESLPLTPNGKIDRRALSQLPIETQLSEEQVAPHTHEEKLLAGIWAEVLGIEQVGIYDNFFELGGHSLLAIQLISKLCESFDVEIPLRELFASPTIAGMIQAIDRARCSSTTDIFDLNAEAVLDSSIQPSTLPVATSVNSIFLTGTTGFLGGYLLYELLVQTTADIHCLVRSTDKNILINKLKSDKLWNEAFNSRIILVYGDLSKPLLGLEKFNFEQLASEVDVIYHNGAWVNFIYPYSVLKTTNVLGTQEVLKLASTFQTKPVHFISTINTIDSSNSGYAQSKTVAEKLVKQAGARGLPVWVYRPPGIAAHSKTGVFNRSDTFSLILKGCIQLGKVPILKNVAVHLIPVDCVSNAIVKLSLQQHSSRSFNLTSPRLTNLNELFSKLRSLGYVLERIPYIQWRDELSVQTENVLYPLLPALPKEEDSFAEPHLQSDYKHEEFIGADWPIIDDKLLDIYLSYFWKSGFLDKPPILDD